MRVGSRLTIGIFTVLLSFTALRGDAGAAPRTRKVASAHLAARGEKGEPPQSIGPPNSGKLAGAAHLKNSHTLMERDGAHPWGLPTLVRALHRAADRVARKARGSILFVGDLSAASGGYLPGHNSHQSGRDADIGFYVTNSKGKPVNAKRFIAFGADGHARDLDWARFDDARNWLLVQSLLDDKEAHVRYLFVSNPLKARLLAAGAKKHASKDLLARAALAMMSPEHADLHDDHFHVRIACPETMRGSCVEESIPRGTGPSHVGAAAAAAGIDPSEPARAGDAATPPREAPMERPDFEMMPGKPSDPPPMGD